MDREASGLWPAARLIRKGRIMDRRTFLQVPGVATLAYAADDPIPDYEVVTAFKPIPNQGMPGPYRGQVVSVHSDKVIDATTEQVDAPTVKEMISRGMRELTATKTDADAWKRFFTPSDVVG